MANPIVIDISHWQPDPIDWAALKSNGTVGVIHKATEGKSYVDDRLFSRAAKALGAGLSWSTYHFMRPGSMAEQMKHYLTTVDPVMGERVCLDHEDAGVSLIDLENAVSYILGQRPDLQITIYSGHVIKEQLSGGRVSNLLAQNTSLWIAQYTSAEAPSWPTGTWPQWSLWQHTDKALAAGISGYVDANRFNGDADACIRWIGPAMPQPAPEPEPEPDLAEVNVNIDAPSDVMVNVFLNGRQVMRGRGED